MKAFLLRLIQRIESSPLTLHSFALSFFALILARLTVEGALGHFAERTFFFLFFELTHTLLFFLCSFLIVVPIVRYAGAANLKEACNVLLFGFLIILTPPIIDSFIFRDSTFWSFYEFDGLKGLFLRFFTLFGDTPDIGITYGVRIEVVLVTLALALYTFLKTARVTRVLAVAFLTYLALFVLGTFPSWITLIALSLEKGLLAIRDADVAALFLTPKQVLGRDLSDFRSVLNFKMSLVYGVLASFLLSLYLWKNLPNHLRALAKNARVPQLFYHAGLLFLGIILSVVFSDGRVRFEVFDILSIFLLLIAVECAWLASVIANDLYDIAIDSLTNPNRPLIEATIPPETYRVYGFFFFGISLLLAGIVSFSALLLILAYQALAWLYSAPPLRLKQHPGLATLIAACAGILVLVIGFVSVGLTHDITALPLPLLTYLFFAYFLAIPIKDFKDIAGDKKDGVHTIPVLFGEHLGKHVIGSCLFLLFAGSPLVLHVSSLFFPALLFGSLAFLALERGTNQESDFFAYRKLPGIILSITFLYGLCISFILLS